MEEHPGSDEQQAEAARKGRYVARHRQTRRSGARRLLIGVNILVGLSLVIGALGVVYTEVQLHRINKVKVHGIVRPGRTVQSQLPAAVAGPGGPPMTVLLVGSDTRAGLHQPGDSQFGPPEALGGARSDTVILARVVPATKQLALLSIPRDLYVDIPGMGQQRINAAFNNGPDLLIQVIRDQLGIDINHYLDIDFDSFRQIADAVGGVQVYFPTKVRDRYSGLSVPAPGCFNLTGDQALGFVRSREYEYYQNGSYHQEAASDLARIQRQQIFIRKLIKKAESTGLSNPLSLNGVISGLTKNLTVDNSFSVSDMVNLARDFHSVDASTIVGSTLATTESTLADGAQVLLPDVTADRDQVQRFLAVGATPAPSSTSSTSVPGSTATTTTVPSPTTVAPSGIEVEVVNGSGVAGQAGRASTALGTIGFNVTSVSSATSSGSGPTEISYGSGGRAAAETVASHISGGTTITADGGLPSSTVKVVLRGSFTGINSSPGSSSASSSSSTSASSTSTTVPSTTTTTTYVLPGTPTDQPSPTCGN
ncbi:MAG: LCP family protein [Actinomycetota bacterium]|nr:LCP family protein [Actinomycetota bacterium]